MTRLAVVRGGGELASAAARLLFLCGLPVVVLEREQPLAVRRRVAFAEAVLAGQVCIEGVTGWLTQASEVPNALERRAGLLVLVDPEGRSLASLAPAVVVDGRMAKRNLGTRRDDADVVIGLGPGFTAGEDVHAAVETRRGPDLGRVIWSGSAAADTAVPAAVEGAAGERVLRAPHAGVFRGACRIGDLVAEGARVGEVDGAPVEARVGGLLRGLLADGVAIAAGVKVGDVDPRGRAVDPARISDKARAVAAGVVEAAFVALGGKA